MLKVSFKVQIALIIFINADLLIFFYFIFYIFKQFFFIYIFAAYICVSSPMFLLFIYFWLPKNLLF